MADRQQPAGTPPAPAAQQSDFAVKLVDFLIARDKLNNSPDDITREQESIAEAAYFYTEERLIETPANDLADLRAKFDIIWLDPQALPNNATVLAIFADFRRLTGGGMSRVFSPTKWLGYFERKGGMYCVRGDDVFLLTPEGADLDDVMFELEASGGREAVFNLIRERAGTEEANDG
jgi:hypothetical protein